MTAYRLDTAELHRRLNAQRARRGLSWRALAAVLGVPASTFTRLAAGGAPGADALVTLLVWLDLDDGVAHVIQPGEAPR